MCAWGLNHVKSEVKTDVRCGNAGAVLGHIALRSHMNVRVPVKWKWLQDVSKRMWDVRYVYERGGNTKHADTSHHTYPGIRQGVTYRNHCPLCYRSWQWTQVGSCPGPQPTTGWHLYPYHGSRNSPHSSPGWYLHLPLCWPHLQPQPHCWRHCHSGLDLLWKKNTIDMGQNVWINCCC